MRRIYLSTAWVLLTGLITGCGADFHAKQIVEYNTGPGKVLEDIAGTAEQLCKTGQIDLHSVYKMPDKTAIDVWTIFAKNPTGDERLSSPLGTVLVLHGLTESKASFPYRGAGLRLARMGYDVVLPDLRGHGRSGGKYVTYGAKEKHDVKAVVDNLLDEGNIHEPIYAFGATLGAATAIQYAAIDPRCKGVLAMTAYQDAETMARRRLMMLSEEDFAKALAKAGELADWDPKEASSVEAARNLTVPLMLVHGMIDLSVPLAHSEAIYAAAGGPKKLVPVTHGPEHFAMFTIMEDWIADKMNMVATGGLSQPAE